MLRGHSSRTPRPSATRRSGTAAACKPMTAAASQRSSPPLPAQDADRIVTLGKALADPIRVGMLAMMAEGRGCCGIPSTPPGAPEATGTRGICVCELEAQFALSQSRTSYHLRVLKEAGLVQYEVHGRWAFYSIVDSELAAALALVSRRLLHDH